MKNTMFSIALAIAAIGAAQAQTPAPAAQQARFFVGAGLTFGGDKLATAQFRNGGEIDIRAGSLVALTAGVDYTVNPQFSLQANVGYHVDDATGSNGDVRFQRFPIEVLAYYHTAPQWRVGVGARAAGNAKLRSSGAADIGDYEFDTSTGGIVEVEYKTSANIGVKVRYVSEKFTLKGTRYDVDGNHVGIFANYYF